MKGLQRLSSWRTKHRDIELEPLDGFGGWGGGLSEKIMDGEWTERWMVKKRKGKVDSVRTESLTNGQTASLIIFFNILLVIFSYRLSIFPRLSSTQFNIYIFQCLRNTSHF